MKTERVGHSTGLPGLDHVLQNLTPGDNVVWRVDRIEDYQAFVEPFYKNAQRKGRRLTYFRFAAHPSLVPDDIGANIHFIHPENGFESFITRVHDVIQENGPGGRYIFDSLSELARDCYSDRMVGNFFMLTCPYLFNLGAIAYFAVLRNYHSTHAAGPIGETTQLLLDVYRYKGKLYVHPMKVGMRFSPTIFMLHAWEGERFIPITNSADVSEILTSVPRSGLESALYQIGVWNRSFVEADEVLQAVKRGEGSQRKLDEMFHRLLRMAVTRDKRFMQLAERFLTLEDLMQIRERMIGTGFIGGKTVGMLLARKIIQQQNPELFEVLESHDSYYIGSEVFYTYLVLNDCWWVRQRQKDPERFLDDIDEARRRIMNGQFPDYMIERFKAMLEYYGQSPIIVRSSSLLEDNFGNLFAGKYESVFCANQGSPDERLTCFLAAVRKIYASSMSEKALSYRAMRGILDVDEQMALLVQRVSGLFYGDLFYPQIAGVGYSFNPYVWSESIDPHAGMVRLVFGLGTRAVDRVDDDYTRLVALNEPLLRPEGSPEEIRRYTQRKVDVLDLDANKKTTEFFSDLLFKSPGLPVELFVTQDDFMRSITRGAGDSKPLSLAFRGLFAQTHILDHLGAIMRLLEEAYQHPVDIEFTINFTDQNRYKINLLQCRPFQAKGSGVIKAIPPVIEDDRLILRAKGAVIGQSYMEPIDRLIYVVPSLYGQLTINDRYSTARLIGKITRLKEEGKRMTTLLVGPGRWGTNEPSLGVPVKFAEISQVSFLGEIVSMRDDLVPDVSLGTHFFSDLVEMGIVYFALFPEREGNYVNDEWITSLPNRLTELNPDAEKFAGVVRVIDFPRQNGGEPLQFLSDALSQRVFAYLEKNHEPS
ncbi:MAG: PEP/pyruvate-binding domain-containing protein [Candidatus Omnitrophica bacterium]|nr:PEP/pyruvate-binding domain-containing protein [Candidatus Omnitrophota bacterium]